MSYGKLFDLHPDPMSVVGPDFAVRRQNAASAEKHGEGRGRRCHDLHFGRTEPCKGCLLGEVLRDGRTESWFLEHRPAPEVAPSYYEITLIPIKDARGDVVEMIEVLRDATMTVGLEHHLIEVSEKLDRDLALGTRRTEELQRQADQLRETLRELQADQATLIQTEKLASLGRLAAGLTHEIHTPLGAIVANLDVLRRRLDALGTRPPGPPDLDKIRDIVELHEIAADRIRKIVGSLRMFAHLDRAVLESVDPHDGIEAALLLLTHEIRGSVEVVRDYGTLPRIPCRPDAMNQVYMNVLQNAVQALRSKPEPGGTIRIATRIEDSEDGGQAVLEFHDDGPGIPAAAIDKVFEPGFTSKPRGIGTGLGLAIAYRTVESHGGTIEVESRPDEDTVFRIRLPLMPENT